MNFNFAETTATATQTNNLAAAKQPEPLFIAVPPRPSRVLHSDAYLRYTLLSTFHNLVKCLIELIFLNLNMIIDCFSFIFFIRYIEGLNVENRYISNWDKQMAATPENTQIPDITKLPAEWLGNGVGNHGNVVNALWTLRNMMMRDVLAINKTL